jgi:hypothetical protein
MHCGGRPYTFAAVAAVAAGTTTWQLWKQALRCPTWRAWRGCQVRAAAAAQLEHGFAACSVRAAASQLALLSLASMQRASWHLAAAGTWPCSMLHAGWLQLALSLAACSVQLAALALSGLAACSVQLIVSMQRQQQRQQQCTS